MNIYTFSFSLAHQPLSSSAPCSALLSSPQLSWTVLSSHWQAPQLSSALQCSSTPSPLFSAPQHLNPSEPAAGSAQLLHSLARQASSSRRLVGSCATLRAQPEQVLSSPAPQLLSSSAPPPGGEQLLSFSASELQLLVFAAPQAHSAELRLPSRPRNLQSPRPLAAQSSRAGPLARSAEV